MHGKFQVRQELRSQNTPKNLINASQPPKAASLSAKVRQFALEDDAPPGKHNLMSTCISHLIGFWCFAQTNHHHACIRYAEMERAGGCDSEPVASENCGDHPAAIDAFQDLVENWESTSTVWQMLGRNMKSLPRLGQKLLVSIYPCIDVLEGQEISQIC